MSKKLSKIMTIVLVAMLVSTVSANTTWTGTSGQDWDTAGNWNDGVPDSLDYAYINLTPGAIIGTGVNANPLRVYVGDSGNGALAISGTGTLTTATGGHIVAGDDAGKSGSITLSDTAAMNINSWNWIGNNGAGTLTMNGGSVVGTGGASMVLANNPGSSGTLHLNAGSIGIDGGMTVGKQGSGYIDMYAGTTLSASSIEISGYQTTGVGVIDMFGGNVSLGTLHVGRNGTGTLNMTGGTINASAVNIVYPGGTGNGSLNLHGGGIGTTSLTMTANGSMHLQDDGFMVIYADQLNTVQGYIDNGLITNARTYLDEGDTMIVAIPEPATMLLLGFGSLTLIRRKRA